MTKPFFITTPIYYVNAPPHIGHAYTTVAADVYARWKKRFGEAVLLTGTDEHGEKIERMAAQAGKDPKAFADEISAQFRGAWDALGVEYGRFIRTTDPDHETTVKHFLQKLETGGYVKSGIYEGLYCVGHEAFLARDDLVDGKCPDHQQIPERYREENYFFLLSKFQDRLQELIESDRISIEPEERKNEILGKLKNGLQDISISRPKSKTGWGVEVPWDASQVVYVWVDALINYYTFGSAKRAWPADLHLVGKDILWFHSVIWPSLLIAVGEEPPRRIFAHGFFTIAGQKMSKTIGNVIRPDELIRRFGRDGARYLLLAAFPFGADGDFEVSRLTEKYNADLANGIGNLASRIATLVSSAEGVLLAPGGELKEKIIAAREKYEDAMESLDFYAALSAIQELVKRSDQYLNETAPWKLGEEEKRSVLSGLSAALYEVAAASAPFMPETAGKIFRALGFEGRLADPSGAAVRAGKIAPLFPRIDV